MATGDDTIRDRVARYSDAQRKTADVALHLFAVNAVAGTSLQMIADGLGVTKAAVYHQFPSKAEIVIAVLETQLESLEAAVDRAEATGPTAESRIALLASMIDGVVEQRGTWQLLQGDPAFLHALGEHAPSRDLWSRTFGFLVGDLSEQGNRVRAAVLSATVGAVGHPFVADVDDTNLAADVLAIAVALIHD